MNQKHMDITLAGIAMSTIESGKMPSFGDVETLARAHRELGAKLEAMQRALLGHRHDLHQYSRRPCATCRESAAALGIVNIVPDSCADREADLVALAAQEEPSGPGPADVDQG